MIARMIRLCNDRLCVELEVKLYSFTYCLKHSNKMVTDGMYCSKKKKPHIISSVNVVP